ncbi:MAG: cation transporter [Anaerolineae bacterium CG2_30_58_95]|nr:MAG: cation transporter [Anaerolineae bacterium CG2_30_58_95]PIU91276.1 MAG: cation transporter [Anaerolineae bacterium CG06_land_8_20_14_3_00_57_67]
MTREHLTNLTRSTARRLALSLGITLAFVVVEILAGVFANSLALLTDAAHNFTDVLALALTGWALWVTTKPAHAGKTYGYHRAGILVALVNSTTLALIALGIFYEAYKRFIEPPVVKADVLIGVGAVAVVVNLGTALLVRRGAEHDLNLKSAFLHLMGDVLSTVGAVAAGILIRFTGLDWIDPLVSLFIGLLILWNAWGIVRESVDILMESTPNDIDLPKLVADVMGVDGVSGVHDLHVWSISQGLRTLSAHILTGDIPISEGAAIQAAVSELLSHKYGITHATLQLECEGCVPADLYCDIANNHAH